MLKGNHSSEKSNRKTGGISKMCSLVGNRPILPPSATDVLQVACALNGAYCWGLKLSKCPCWVKGQVRQKAPGPISLDLLNECKVIRYVGQQSHAESRPTCWRRTSTRHPTPPPPPAMTCGDTDSPGIQRTTCGFWVITGPNQASRGPGCWNSQLGLGGILRSLISTSPL